MVFISDDSSITDWENHQSYNHRETQVPSIWSDSFISLNFNQGSFSSGDTVYLDIVDEDGAVNTNGYHITIGATSSCSDGIFWIVLLGSLVFVLRVRGLVWMDLMVLVFRIIFYYGDLWKRN